MARRKQRGGAYRPRGLVNRGSGRIDPSTGNLRLSVDDVPAVLGRNEYVVNSGAVRKVGTRFLDNINNLGLGNSSVRPNTLGYGSNYQYGGTTNGRSGGGTGNPITQTNLYASQNDNWIFKDSGLTYVGNYHKHQNGEYMIGAGQMGVNHELKPDEIIVKQNNRSQQNGDTGNGGYTPFRARAYKRRRNRRKPNIGKQHGGRMGMGDNSTLTPGSRCSGECLYSATGGSFDQIATPCPSNCQCPSMHMGLPLVYGCRSGLVGPGTVQGGTIGNNGNQTLGRMDMYSQYTDPYNEDIMHRQMGGISSTKSIAGRGGMGGAGNQTFEYDIADCIRAGFRGEMAKICAQGIHHQHME